jgi:hypothetical protein
MPSSSTVTSDPALARARAQPTLWSSATPSNVTNDPTPVSVEIRLRRCSSDSALRTVPRLTW